MATTTVNESAADSLESIGISRRFAWRLAGTLFISSSSTSLILGGFRVVPQLDVPAILYADVVAIAIGLALIFIARYSPADRWLHIPAFIGYATIAIPAMTLEHSLVVSYVAVYMLPAVAVAFLLGLRHSPPHAAVAAALIVITLVVKGEPAVSTRSLTLVFAIVGCVLMIGIVRRQMATAAHEYRSLAASDPLTGIANPRGLHQQLATAIDESERAGERLAVFAIDLDRFKLVNDTLSHSVGDTVLIEVARTLMSRAAPGDLVARRGGDEFIYVARGLEALSPEATAGELARELAAARQTICPDIEAGVSVGHTVWIRGEQVDSLLARADAELCATRQASRSGHRAPTRSDAVEDNGRPAWQDAHSGPVAAGDASDPRDLRPTARPRIKAEPTQRELRTAWLLAATMSAFWGLSIGALALSGLDANLRGTSMMVGAAICLVSAIAYLYIATRRTRQVYIHVTALFAAGTTVIFLAGAGTSAPALVDGYLVTILFVFLFLPPLQAIPYLIGEMGLYAWFLTQSDSPYAATQITAGVVVAVLTTATLSLMRRRTAAYATLVAAETEIDPLTGIANLRALRRHLGATIASTDDVTILQLDLDDFKLVNDLYSHTVGDAILRRVAHAIDGAIGAEHYCARRGGDEFTIVVKAAPPRVIADLTHRVNQAIEHERRLITPTIRPTVALGCTRHVPGESIDLLIKRADLALHDAKRAGRERLAPAAANGAYVAA